MSLVARSSPTILPILRVGFRALIAYCGTMETALNRNLFIAIVSEIGSDTPSSSTWPPM